MWSTEGLVRIGIEFPKSEVKLPKAWNKLEESVYRGERNWMVLTGKVNDIIVIDMDKKGESNIKSIDWFNMTFGRVPEEMDTYVTGSINGGYHVYFKYNGKIKNINNKEMKLDILTDGKGVYQGDGYKVMVDVEPRELRHEELEAIIGLECREMVVAKNVCYKKINDMLRKPSDTVWDIERQEKGIKATPICKQCIVNPCKEHSEERHSALYINNDKTVVKTCYSCGSDVLDKRESKKVMNIFNVILNVKNEENTIYQQLVRELVDICEEQKYKREKLTGVVYKQVKPYAYVRYKGPMDFLNEIFYGDADFKSHVANMDNLIKYMKQYDDPRFAFIEYNKDYIGFRNGVLNVETCEFTKDSNVIVKKYIDEEFKGSESTPLMDKILDYQFSEDVRDFIYACLGRMFGIRDNFGFMLYLLGEAGCGKSLIIDVISKCFNDVGAIGDSYETKYGLSYLHDKDIVVCDDLPKDIHKIFPQQTFQTIITGGQVPSAVKNGDAIMIEWKTPLLFAGNWLPSYLDKGQVSRRLLVANFEKNVYEPDVTLKDRIIREELPALIYKCVKYYKRMREENVGRGIWQICPEYFREQQEELRKERNPLYKFLVENTMYKEGNIVRLEEIKIQFGSWLGKKVNKLDNGTFGQVNKEYMVESKMICKSCEREHKKNCCEDYKRINRTSTKIIRNIGMCVQMVD